MPPWNMPPMPPIAPWNMPHAPCTQPSSVMPSPSVMRTPALPSCVRTFKRRLRKSWRQLGFDMFRVHIRHQVRLHQKVHCYSRVRVSVRFRRQLCPRHFVCTSASGLTGGHIQPIRTGALLHACARAHTGTVPYAGISSAAHCASQTAQGSSLPSEMAHRDGHKGGCLVRVRVRVRVSIRFRGRVRRAKLPQFGLE